MPVPLTCSCGKQMRVPDEMAGRRIKCPACGEAQLVPADADTPRPTSRKTASSPSSEVDEGMVRFRCECGKQMQARAAHAGKSTRCPACEAMVTIPGGPDEDEDEDDRDDRRSRIRAGRPAPRGSARRDEDDEDEAPRSRRGRYRDEEDEDEDDRDDRDLGRRRRPRKSSVWVWVTVGVGALLLIGGGVLAWFLIWGSGTTADLDLIPGNAQGFISVRVADLWNHDFTRQALAQAKQKNPQMPDLAAEAEKNFGLSPADVERVTFVFGDVKKNLVWGIVLTTKPYDRKKILDKLGSPQERKQGSKTYQVANKGGEPLALYFHTDRIFLISNEKGLQHSLTLLDGKHVSGPLDSVIKKVSGKHHLMGGMVTLPEIAQAKGRLPAELAAFKPLLDFQTVSFKADIGKSTSDLELAATFPDGDMAKAAKQAVEGALAMARLAAPALGAQGLSVDQINKSLDSIKVKQSGSELTVSMSGPNGDPGQLANAISGAMGGNRIGVPVGPVNRPGQPGIRPGQPGIRPGQPGFRPGGPGVRPRGF